MGFVPQGNRVFDEMTVLENLEIGGLHLPKNRLEEGLKKIWELFRELEKRKNKTQKTERGREINTGVGQSLDYQPTTASYG